MMDFSAVQGLIIPQGVVTQIERGSTVLWRAGGGAYDELLVTISENAAGGLTYTITSASHTVTENLSGGLTYAIGG